MEDIDLRDAFGQLDREARGLVLRFLAGAATPEEERWARQWLQEDPRREELIQRVRRARVVAGIAPELWGVDEAGQRLLARIGAAAATNSTDTSDAADTKDPSGDQVLPFRQRPAAARAWRSSRGPLRTAARLAATIALMAGGALLWQHRAALLPGAGAMQEYAAGIGERGNLTLADGSHVVLAPGSRIAFPKRFGKTREVRLEGEAVFDVASDSARPFRVHAGPSTTQVLGTRFGVRAYPEDQYVEVVLAEGRVAVSGAPAATLPQAAPGGTGADAGTDPRDHARSARHLTPGQAVRVTADGAVGSPRAVDAARLLSWTDGNLYFNRTPLVEVTRTLARRYGVEVELAGSRLAELHLTAEFLQPTLAEVVRLISLSLGLEYRQTETGYILSRPTPTTDTARDGGSN